MIQFPNFKQEYALWLHSFDIKYSSNLWSVVLPPAMCQQHGIYYWKPGSRSIGGPNTLPCVVAWSDMVSLRGDYIEGEINRAEEPSSLIYITSVKQ